MQDTVKMYVNQCDICRERKDPRIRKRHHMKSYFVGTTFERVATDIAGPFPVTKNKNKYILVVADYFSKLTKIYPMPDMRATTVAAIIVRAWVKRYGCPTELHSDQGRQYESLIFKELCQLLEIHKTRTTPLHPRSDGMVERMNRTVNDTLSKYIKTHQRDWDMHLDFITMAYNSTTHESTEVSPHRTVFGHEMKFSLDIITEPVGCQDKNERFIADYVNDLDFNLRAAHDFAGVSLKIASERQKTSYEIKVKPVQYNVGAEGENNIPVNENHEENNEKNEFYPFETEPERNCDGGDYSGRCPSDSMEIPESSARTEEEKVTMPPVKCEFCDSTYATRRNLKRHINAVHDINVNLPIKRQKTLDEAKDLAKGAYLGTTPRRDILSSGACNQEKRLRVATKEEDDGPGPSGLRKDNVPDYVDGVIFHEDTTEFDNKSESLQGTAKSPTGSASGADSIEVINLTLITVRGRRKGEDFVKREQNFSTTSHYDPKNFDWRGFIRYLEDDMVGHAEKLSRSTTTVTVADSDQED
ncbi:unnamed protein product [Mytilus coruscus]|uniref:Integrase catalytic domain-containing protein n=1 Tax=Mytilus coruscus TaxID=42192 RepID=A0A6J8AMW3_MYTCO|nr:unnamed protein product [Mytilus coruscus]